jgi:nucleotide-binding universal stress UspA family protein
MTDNQQDEAIDFETVLCGVDVSPQSAEAVTQGALLAADGARLFALSAWDPGLAIHAGIHAQEVAVDLREESLTALRRAKEVVPSVDQMHFKGAPVACLLAAATNLSADLVSVGSHGMSRPTGIFAGSVTSAMAHHAPCSVLIARKSKDGAEFPSRILHAGDGSPESQQAARVAGVIASRRGGSVATLHINDDGTSPSQLAEEAVSLIEATGVEPVTLAKEGSPHREIVETANSMGTSLIVLGSRGLKGLKALGSVSERVAHQAPCSVLIVRRPAHPFSDADQE